MLSILIPIYNYDVRDLVNELHLQVSKTGIDFEIICLDDKSDESFINTNKPIDSLSHTTFALSNTNKGIAGTRQDLVKRARYDWILLVDADTQPKSNKYIENFLKYINSDHEAIFGSFAYMDEPPTKDKLLRWNYGKKYESIDANKRNKNPYKVTIAANLLIKRNIYEKLQLDQPGKYYGMDLLFGPKLKANQIKVMHIDNQVYHLGLESSKRYLDKTKLAVETLWNLYKSGQMEKHENTLLTVFLMVKKFGLRPLLSFGYNLFNKSMTQKLTGKNPSARLFQWFKLMYLCKISYH